MHLILKNCPCQFDVFWLLSPQFLSYQHQPLPCSSVLCEWEHLPGDLARVRMFASMKRGQRMRRRWLWEGQSLSKSCSFSPNSFVWAGQGCGIEQGHSKGETKPDWDPRDWKLGKIPLHLNSSKQAICYPISFSGTDEQVVFRRSLSIFSFWNLSNSRCDWLLGPHDNSEPRLHTGSRLLPGVLRRGEVGRGFAAEEICLVDWR